MKKIYLLMLLFISTTAMAQTPIITMVLSSECQGAVPKIVEIYAQGTVDFSLYTLENQTNANTTWGVPTDLSALGIVTDEFVYVHSGGTEFAAQFPSATNVLIATGSTMSINGDDRLRIIETGSTTVIDQFGEESVDGTGTAWEYLKGYIKRNDNTGPNGSAFDINEWTGFNGALVGICGTSDLYEDVTNAGSFTYGTTTTPTINTSAATVSGFFQVLGSSSAEQSVNISGSNLTADVVVTVNSGEYEISLTSGGPYSPAVTIPFGTATLAATPVYIVLNGTAVAAPSNGDLLVTSGGATDLTIALEGIINDVLCNTDYTTTLVDKTVTANATGVNYQWIDCSDNSLITTETGVSFTATESGSYAVIITDGVCVDTSACVTVNVSGLNDIDFSGVSVYPNPVKEVLNITNENGTLESVEVVSTNGSVVYISTVTSNNFTVNTAQLNAGVYFVNVRTANSVKTFKVIK